MAKTELFYRTQTGTTQTIAEAIQQAFEGASCLRYIREPDGGWASTCYLHFRSVLVQISV